MTRYLVDTTTIIDFSKDLEPQTSRLMDLLADRLHDIGTCDVVIAEFFSGVAPDEHPRWERFFAGLAYWQLSPGGAARAGSDRFTNRRRGQAINTTDAMIAAIAREHNAVLITGNMKDFPQTGVTLLSLR